MTDVWLRILSGHCRIHREAPGIMLYTEIRHISRLLIAGAFLHAKKARVGSGNSMRYLHCHFYRVDFNQGLSGCATAWP
ncbi:hypothetical protein ACI3S3_005208, partial [Escherichia coli]